MGLVVFLKNKISKRKSVLLSLVVSYLFILLIPIVISGFVYFESTQIIEKEITKSNTVMLRQIQKSIDKKMADVQRLSTQIALSSEVNTIIYTKNPMDSRSRYLISQFQKELRNYKITNGFIDELYIFFHDVDYVMSSQTVYSIDFLSSYMEDIERVSAQQYMSLKGNLYYNLQTSIQVWETSDKKKSTIAYVQSLPNELSARTKASLITLLNYEAFLSEISNIEGVDSGSVLILNKNNHIISQTNMSEEMEGLVYQDFQNDSIYYKNIKDQNYIISSIDSQMNDWKYLFILPNSLFMEKVEYIKRLSTVSIALCLLLGGFVAYLLTKRNYNPVKELVKAIAGLAGIELIAGINEYKFIEQAINYSVTEKEIVVQKLKKQNETLRSSFLARLIKGNWDQSVPIEEVLSSYDIRWLGDHFCVLLFYIDWDAPKTKKYLESMSSDNQYKALELIQFIITNMVNEATDKRHKAYVTEVDGMIACLINVKENHEETRSEISNMAHRILKQMSKSFSISLTISIGNINRTYAGILQSYQEAQEAMEYRMVMGNERVIWYNEIVDPNKQYNYPLEVEQQLINSIKIGDIQKARDILNNVFQNHFSKGIFSIEMTKCLVFDLMSTMIKAMNDLNMQDNSTFIEELDPVSRLSSADTVITIKYEMVYILEKICEFVVSYTKSHNQKIVEQITAIIDSSYNDANLTITSIASQLELTGPYISKMFRDQMGESIQDYINKARLKLAKKLLVENQCNLDIISEQVGYTNSNGLIRIFKKYEGLTPGQFREASKQG